MYNRSAGCCVESPSKGAKGKDFVNKTKFLASLRIGLVFVNMASMHIKYYAY